MNRWTLAMSLVLVAVLSGCQSTTAPEGGEPANPATIQVKRFDSLETGIAAPIPFRKTGDLYVLETGCDCVLAITPAGKVSIAVTTKQILNVTGQPEVSMTGAGIAFDAAGTMYFSESDSHSILKKERGGTLGVLASEAALLAATGDTDIDMEGLAVDASGGLYVNDNVTDSILRVDVATGEVTVLADGKALGSLLGLPTANLASGLTVGKGGVVFTANEDDPQAIIGIEPGQDPAIYAMFGLFEGLDGFLTVASNGDLIIMDAHAEIVFKAGLDGAVSTFLSEPQLQAPIDGEDGRYNGGIAFDGDDNFYVTESHENHILRFDQRFRGTIWVDRAAIQTVTRTTPDLDAGIAFAPAPAE